MVDARVPTPVPPTPATQKPEMIVLRVLAAVAAVVGGSSAFVETPGCPPFSFLQGAEEVSGDDDTAELTFSQAIPWAGSDYTIGLMHDDGFFIFGESGYVSPSSGDPPETADLRNPYPTINAFWTDMGTGYKGSGYLAMFSDCSGADAAVCSAVDAELANRAGVVGFTSQIVVTITYDGVDSNPWNGPDVLIDIQIAVASDGVSTYVFFIYGRLEQVPSGRVVATGMSDGSSTYFWEMPFSRTDDIHLMNTFGNYGHPGCFVFEVSVALPAVPTVTPPTTTTTTSTTTTTPETTTTTTPETTTTTSTSTTTSTTTTTTTTPEVWPRMIKLAGKSETESTAPIYRESVKQRPLECGMECGQDPSCVGFNVLSHTDTVRCQFVAQPDATRSNNAVTYWQIV